MKTKKALQQKKKTTFKANLMKKSLKLEKIKSNNLSRKMKIKSKKTTTVFLT